MGENMVGLEQGLLYSIIIGICMGVALGIRKLYLLERVILNLDRKMERMLEKIEREEELVNMKSKRAGAKKIAKANN